MKPSPKILIPVILGVFTLAAAAFVVIFIINQSASNSENSNGTSDSSDSATNSDQCLQGNWVMERAQLDLLVSSVVPVQGLTIPAGEISMQFNGDNYVYSGQYTIRISPSESTYLEAEARHSNTGTFSADGRTIEFTSEVSESEAMVWSAYQDGKKVTTGGTGPSYDYPQPGSAPYRCNSTTLEIDTRGANDTELTMFFTKRR